MQVLLTTKNVSLGKILLVSFCTLREGGTISRNVSLDGLTVAIFPSFSLFRIRGRHDRCFVLVVCFAIWISPVCFGVLNRLKETFGHFARSKVIHSWMEYSFELIFERIGISRSILRWIVVLFKRILLTFDNHRTLRKSSQGSLSSLKLTLIGHHLAPSQPRILLAT